MTGIEPDEDSFRHRVPRDISVKNAKDVGIAFDYFRTIEMLSSLLPTKLLQIRRQGMVPEDLTGAGTTEGMTTTNFDDTLA